jgi:DNA invertase Pin-like site-specific DNA recombinase
MDVVIYTRVSTDEQRENGFSLQDQERRLRQHCEQFNKNIIEHYQDDYSAKNFNRPEFIRFLNDVSSNRIKPKQIICVRVDRFSRNVEESLQMVNTLKALKIELLFLENNFDLSTPENYLPYLIQMALPQIENERRGLNTKQGMRQALRLGKWMWKAPKGYQNDKLNKLIIVGEEAHFITTAFNEIATGLNSIDSIRLRLSKEGFKCSKQQFLNILKNPFYCGLIKIEAWKNEPEELVKGLHKPLIPFDLFNRVQSIIDKRKRKQFKASKINPLFPLRGHLKCKDCGDMLTASSSKGRSRHYSYYHCQRGCKERFDSSLANNSFNDYLETIIVNKEVSELYLEIYKSRVEEIEGSKEKKKVELEKKLQSIHKEQYEIDSLLSCRKLSIEDFSRISQGIKSNISIIEEDIAQLSNNIESYDKHLSFGISLISHLPYYYQSSPVELKSKLLGSIFAKSLVFDGKSYRTEKPNLFLDLICSDSISYRGSKKEKTSNSRGQSNWAPLVDDTSSYQPLVEYIILYRTSCK